MAKRAKFTTEFKLQYDIPKQGNIYGEWGKCVCCGQDAICLKVCVSIVEPVEICQTCTTRVFAETYTNYRERDDMPSSIYGIPVEDAIGIIEESEAGEPMDRLMYGGPLPGTSGTMVVKGKNGDVEYIRQQESTSPA